MVAVSAIEEEAVAIVLVIFRKRGLTEASLVLSTEVTDIMKDSFRVRV
jgi:hypothetical protein